MRLRLLRALGLEEPLRRLLHGLTRRLTRRSSWPPPGYVVFTTPENRIEEEDETCSQ